MRKLIAARRLSQIVFLALFIFILWSTTYPLQGIISPQIIFKLDPLIMFVTALSEHVLLPGMIFSVVMVLLTFILGRFFCGWMCPMGTIIDWTGALSKIRRIELSAFQRRDISKPKFFILALILLAALTGRQAAWILDPIVTVARVISLNVIPAVTLAVDRAFQLLIQQFNLYGVFYDFYRFLKEGLLGVNVYFFSNSLVTLAFFLVFCGGAILILRLWCRMLCPLGAWYACNAKPAWLERRVTHCRSCGICVKNCRMGAIEKDTKYRKSECILCMDCVYGCPEQSTVFRFRNKPEVHATKKNEKTITRKQFLLVLGTALSSLGLKFADGASPLDRFVIRPPGALPEGQFVNICIRCGNCMKVCPTNGLQPVMLDAKLSRLWTPQLVPEVGYCEYNCTLCGEVCPTGAVPKLSVSEKHKEKLGLAVIDRLICLAWGGNKECIVCEEHCPVAEKAIKRRGDMIDGGRIWRPLVDEKICIGCGICQNKCPVRPVRAIRVHPIKV